MFRLKLHPPHTASIVTRQVYGAMKLSYAEIIKQNEFPCYFASLHPPPLSCSWTFGKSCFELRIAKFLIASLHWIRADGLYESCVEDRVIKTTRIMIKATGFINSAVVSLWLGFCLQKVFAFTCKSSQRIQQKSNKR